MIRRPLRTSLFALGALTALTALSVAGCSGGGSIPGDGAFRGAPVVLISIDTLRSDHLPIYGYKGVETPAIDALRRDGVLYTRAYSHVPLTLPSHVSILTGLLPADHGVRDNVGYRLHSDRVPYLPRVLKAAGYTTGGFVSTYVLRAETGLADGFDHYDGNIEVRLGESLGRSQRPGGETLKLAEEWLDKITSGPFFLFFHLYEPHTPYEPPEPFASRYKEHPYDGEIAAADALVGQLVAELKQKGVYDKAIVILLSDHGEGLLEHGEQEHGVLLYREALQVPLVVKLPGSRLAGRTADRAAQLIDVFPTIAALTGAKAPAGPGTSLLALLAPDAKERQVYAETYYPRLHMGWSDLHSLIESRFHLIDGPDPELYDLVADPGEKVERRQDERRAFTGLRQAVAAYVKPLAAPAAVDAETARRLASLGYLGAATTATRGPLPDPKTRVHAVADFAQALGLFAHQQFAQAVPAFERVLRDNPDMADGWESLGQALQHLGRQEDALAAFDRAMKLTGGVGHVALAKATVLLDLHRLDEAEEHAKLGLETGPANAHSLLAQIAFERGDHPLAEREAQAALAARGSRVGPLLTMAQVLRAEGHLEQALAKTDEAVAELDHMQGEKKFPGLYFVRGDVLARLDRPADAEKAFLREIQDAPGNPRAYSRLAILYATEGRAQEAVDALHRMVAHDESPAAYAEAVKTFRILGDPATAAALLRHALAMHPESRELRALSG
ncbi:MAG TPA: sulfatase-like hydrolase/transferase [Thermoanaerobaculia bacterium]